VRLARMDRKTELPSSGQLRTGTTESELARFENIRIDQRCVSGPSTFRWTFRISLARLARSMEHGQLIAPNTCCRSSRATAESVVTSSSCRSVVIVQHAAEALALLHSTWVRQVLRLGVNQSICQTLVIALGVIVDGEIPDGYSQRLLSKQNHPLQTGFLYRPYEPLGKRIQIR